MGELRKFMNERILPMKQRQQEIKRIIAECEDVQESNESRYTKKCARLRAYERIREVMDAE